MNIYMFLNPITRTFTCETEGVAAVRDDYEVDAIVFKLPSVIENADPFYDTKIVSFTIPGSTRIFTRTLDQIDSDANWVYVTWPLTAAMAEKVGTIRFALLLKGLSQDLSTITTKWRSQISSFSIVDTLSGSDTEPEEEEEDATTSEKIAALNSAVFVLQSQINKLVNGTPIPVSLAAEMTDPETIYVYTGSETGYTDGYWYYYDGSAWVAGGEYGAASTDKTLTQPGMPADAEAAGEAINTLSEDLGVLMPEATEEDVGKALIVKDVEAGKVTEYEFGEAGGVDSYTFVPPNMYDKDNKVGTMTINGTSVSGLSNWIELKAGAVYTTDYTSTAFYFFNASKEYLSTQTLISTPNRILADADGYLLIRTKGADKSFVRGSYLEYNPGVVSRWNGKRWLAIGDSITAIDHADKGYPFIVGSNLGMEVTNVGSSGKIMAFFHDLIPQYADDYDLITVMLGTNNHGYNTAIGSLNDTYYQQEDYDSPNSFYAQTQRVADLLIAKYPYAVIAFFTPIRRAVGASDGSDWVNALGLTTKAYADAVKAVCDYYGLPCLDLYTHGINPRYDAIRATYFVGGDGTHPNNAGHAKYTAPAINGLLLDRAPFAYDFPIVSISATYTGGEVPAGTNPNHLTGLTVTAHRANGVSEEVTGYTLSGTIGIGQNTITVTYDGLTTTFSVTGIDVPIFELLHQYTYTAGGEDFGNDIKGFHDEVGDYDISTEYDSAKVRGANDSSATTLASWGLYPGDSFTLEFLGVKRTSRYPQSQGIAFLMTSGSRNTPSMGRGSTDRFASVNQGGTTTQATATPLNIGYYGGENGTTNTVESSENTFAPQNGEPQDIVVRYDASTGHVTSYVDDVKFHDFYVNSARKQYIHTDGISLDTANVITGAYVIFSQIKIYKGIETET